MYMFQKENLLQNGTKIWLIKNGGCIPANNAAYLSNNELNTLLEFISAQWFYICSEWQTHFIDKKTGSIVNLVRLPDQKPFYNSALPQLCCL
ncbi:hypothetical protein TRPE111910_09860 [Treponema peruense]